jgi:hypothetical protein
MVVFKPASLRIPVPVRDLPAHHIIESGDLTIKRVNKSDIAAGVVLTAKDAIKRYTREALKASQPILSNQIGTIPDQRLIANTLAVDIPLSRVENLSGQIQAGDVVSVAALSPQNNPAPVPILTEVLVLNVNSPATAAANITLAIPMNQWPDFMTKTQNAKLILAKQVK